MAAVAWLVRPAVRSLVPWAMKALLVGVAVYLTGAVGFEIVSRYGVGLLGKVVERAPSLSTLLVPPVVLANCAGKLALSPTLFLLLRKP